MGVALGWISLALAVVGGEPEAGRGGVPIKYTVRFMEVEGLGWRDAVYTRLTPVTRQGAATVWTAPADVAKRVVASAAKSPSAHMIQAPAVTAWAGVPAHITTRANRRLVTQAAWTGDDGSVESKPETVHTGSSATMAGRKMDQGVLVQMVLQDTQILAVHRVALGGPRSDSSDPAAKKAAYHAESCEGASTCCETGEKAKKSDSLKVSFEWNMTGFQGITLPTARYITDDLRLLVGPSSATRKLGTEPSPKATGGVIAASVPASECGSQAASCATPAAACSSRAVSVEVPEIGSQEIAGEWLIPNDGILLVSFGPHTVADKEGKAVIRERLAIVEADEAAEPLAAPAAPPTMWGTPVPAYAVPIVPAPAAMAMPPEAVTPSPSAVPAPAAPATPMPPMPSRSMPQGYHKDGKAAELPPLPAEEADDEDDADDSSGSAEARPSPQMKKPRQPGAMKTAKARPSTDTAMKKAQFSLSNFQAIPTLFQPAPAVGLQFLLPIKPVSFKLPFNRRLEIEIYGRVIRAPEPAARSSADLATKGAPTTK